MKTSDVRAGRTTRALRELPLELPWAPAGVAGEDADAPQLAQVADGVDLPGKPTLSTTTPPPGRVGEVRQHDDGLGLNGAAEVDELVRAGQGRHRGHGFLDRHVRDAVEHHAHGALVAVLADEHHGAAEVRGRPARPGDEEVAAERAHRGIFARPDRFRAGGPWLAADHDPEVPEIGEPVSGNASTRRR